MRNTSERGGEGPERPVGTRRRALELVAGGAAVLGTAACVPGAPADGSARAQGAEPAASAPQPAQPPQLGSTEVVAPSPTPGKPFVANAFPPPDQLDNTEWLYFRETGHYVALGFKGYFERSGGVGTFGLPLTEEIVEDGQTVQYFQRARMTWTTGPAHTPLEGEPHLEAVGLAAARQRATPPRIARVDVPRLQDQMPVHAMPNSEELVTRLPQDAQLRVTGERRGPDGETWFAVRLWNAVDGYVKVDGLAFTPAPPKPPATGGAAAAPWKPTLPPPQGPFPLQARGRTRAAVDVAGEADTPAIGRLAANTPLGVRAWRTDVQGRAWVQLDGGPGVSDGSWILAERFTPEAPDPLTARAASGQPLADLVRGTGMWFTYDVLRETPVAHVIATARANGFSFLAPELGTSRRGYWASEHYDRLLPAAHDAGLKVIPWVYPWLVDLPGDLDLALKALRHATPSGDRPDALGVDLEENLDEGANRAFSQLLRAMAGPEACLAAIVYQPQIASGRQTAYAALAESFNVLVPMSYWHGRPIRYTRQDAYTYVADSVRLIRERVGRRETPVAVIGQTFEWFSRNEIGPHNPTRDEIRGSIDAVRDTGALGIGYFNWYSTTPEEWDAIRGE